MKKLLSILLFVPLVLFGQNNYSLSLDGVGDHVVVNPSLSMDTITSFSFGGWFKITSNQEGAWNTTLLAKLNTDGDLDSELNPHLGGTVEGFALQLLSEPFEPTNHFSCYLLTNNGSAHYLSVQSQSAFIPNSWTHIICTYSNGVLRMYVNGELNSQASWDLDLAVPMNQFLTIGADIDDLSTNNTMGVSQTDIPITLDGFVDDVLFYNTELSSEQVQLLMTCGPSGDEDGLVGYWDFNQQNENVIIDVSGNDNNGNIYGGAALSNDVPETSCSILDQLYASFNAWNITIDLSAGWNMFGYGCPTSIDVADGLSNHTESIIITKDNNGNVYMPEFGFNGIGNFTPGFGYQIKLTEAIEDFSLCDWYVNDIPEDNIVSLQEENANLENEVANLESALDSIYGCIDDIACNYDESASLDDGSCTYPEQGYDCDGNITEYIVGMEAEGGIVFYVDETGESGLVADTGNVAGMFEWGCFDIDIPNLYPSYILSGLENTQNIINQNCQTEDGNMSAAEFAISFENQSYVDWFLPSKSEFQTLIDNIGLSDELFHPILGNFSYWTSTQWGNFTSFSYDSELNVFVEKTKHSECAVIPIRAFGYTLGCMDLLASNFNPEANMADGSCCYAEQGYDCDGNITAEIGDILEGGYLFYLDETAERGLVAAMEDLDGSFEWGCDGESVNGADGIIIGSGYQNTMDIVNQGCSTENGGITAAEATIGLESAGYSDWFMPSINELHEIYLTIGNSLNGNIASLELENNPSYSSSSEYDIHNEWVEFFENGNQFIYYKPNPFWVRPIRAFGNWTMGCMDSLACNFNPEANMADGSCTYSEEGYDCEGNQIHFSLNFDTINHYAEVPNSSSFDLTNFSVSFWIKPSESDAWGSPVSKDCCGCENTNGDWAFFIHNNELNFYAQNTIQFNWNKVVTYQWPDFDTWYYISASRNEGQISLYVNGEIVSSIISDFSGEINNQDPLRFGKYASCGEYSNNFLLKNVELWSSSLTSEQIQFYMSCPPTGNEASLIGYWNFNEGQGNTVYDLSGNENNGTINGASYSTDTPESNCE